MLRIDKLRDEICEKNHVLVEFEPHDSVFARPVL